MKSLHFYLIWLAFVLVFMIPDLGEAKLYQQERDIGMAVEFMDHAACAYVARDKGWYRRAGLRITSYESYVTGMALAAALARGDIQAAYMCLVPAINVFANARVKIRVVAGTHKYGYGLVINPHKIGDIRDLEKQGIRIGCVREGGAVDLLLNRTIEKYHLNRRQILGKVQRMNPPSQVLAIKAGLLDAAFLPEQWATMAESYGFRMLLTARDLWPHMQGSVLVVKDDLIMRHPDLVKKLVDVTHKATCWLRSNQHETSLILAKQLSLAGNQILPIKAARSARSIEITPDILLKSMSRLEYQTDIVSHDVQQIIDYTAKLNYIPHSFPAKNILDLRFLHQ